MKWIEGKRQIERERKKKKTIGNSNERSANETAQNKLHQPEHQQQLHRQELQLHIYTKHHSHQQIERNNKNSSDFFSLSLTPYLSRRLYIRFRMNIFRSELFLKCNKFKRNELMTLKQMNNCEQMVCLCHFEAFANWVRAKTPKTNGRERKKHTNLWISSIIHHKQTSKMRFFLFLSLSLVSFQNTHNTHL